MSTVEKVELDDGCILSIVIVTYNMEKYINQLLRSITDRIQEQYLRRIEIIISDDCSNDSTVKIIEEFFEKVKISHTINVHEENSRVPGKGLNFGINNAKGKYIHLIDGDDVINSEVYNTFFNSYMYEKDIDMFDFSQIFFDRSLENCFKLIEIKNSFLDIYPYSKTQIEFSHIIRSYLYGSKILKKSFIANNNLKFDEENSSQDKTFFIDFYMKHPTIKYNTDVLLYYRCGIESISTGIGLNKFKINQRGTNTLKTFFEPVVVKENDWQLYLLAHSKESEVKDTLSFFKEQQMVFSTTTIPPKTLNFRQWNMFLSRIAVDKQNTDIVKIQIINNHLLKEIINCNDYKVSGMIAPLMLEKIVLLNIFLEIRSKKLLALDHYILLLLNEISIASLVKVLPVGNKKNLIELIKKILEKLSESEIKIFKHTNRICRRIETNEEIIAYFDSYSDKIEKISIILFTENNKKATEAFLDELEKVKQEIDIEIVLVTVFDVIDNITNQFNQNGKYKYKYVSKESENDYLLSRALSIAEGDYSYVLSIRDKFFVRTFDLFSSIKYCENDIISFRNTNRNANGNLDFSPVAIIKNRETIKNTEILNQEWTAYQNIKGMFINKRITKGLKGFNEKLIDLSPIAADIYFRASNIEVWNEVSLLYSTDYNEIKSCSVDSVYITYICLMLELNDFSVTTRSTREDVRDRYIETLTSNDILKFEHNLNYRESVLLDLIEDTSRRKVEKFLKKEESLNEDQKDNIHRKYKDSY